MAGASQLESGAAALTGTAALVVLAYRLGSGQPATVALGAAFAVLAWDGVARGVLEVGPDLSPARAAAVHRLRALGLRPVLLAAEEAPIAQAVAAHAGLPPDAVLAGVAAPHATRLVRELGPGVAVIADPERYGAALDAADLAVRIGCTGTTSRAALTLVRGSDLATAVAAIRLARHTAAVTRTNLACSLACVAVLLPLTAAGVVGPSLSAAATAAGAAVLTINSLRPQRSTSTGG